MPSQLLLHELDNFCPLTAARQIDDVWHNLIDWVTWFLHCLVLRFVAVSYRI